METTNTFKIANITNNSLSLKWVLFLLLNISLFSCETEIPDTDTTPPTFSIKITGDGFERTFSQDDNFDSFQLFLKTNQEYDILFSGTDQGGVKLVQLQYPKDYINFTTEVSDPWADVNVSGLSNMLNWQGNQDSPLTAGIFVGKFIPTGINIGAEFNIYVQDFGGESSNYNSISKYLNIMIGNHDTEVHNF